MAPAKVYLNNVLLDIAAVAKYNVDHFTDTEKMYADLISTTGPIYEKLRDFKQNYLSKMKAENESTSEMIANHTRRVLSNFVDGKLLL